ncbi:MAG: magnesium/cobalt transporter CorA [Bacteroidales bacterium]|nr:magnesium/cobalt transporter CorA [Bacteroidales bacterium]MBN2757554.1 magnesium/cobalt transporter CorA [Bacteroidales bacterium]
MAKKTINRKTVYPNNPVFTGNIYEKEISIQLFTYNKDTYTEKSKFSEKEFKGFNDLSAQHWLNIHGIHDTEIISEICNKLKIHNLVIQDILDVNQRPKFQEYENYCFFSIKSMLTSDNQEIESEQLSFILGKNFLVSFQERKADYFDHVRERIKNKVGILRERTTDYLLFLLLESILDNYFMSIDNIEKNIENFEISDLNSDPSPTLLKAIELYRREIHLIKKTIIPIKEFVVKIEIEKFEPIDIENIKYFLELKDLCLMLIDNCDKIDLRLESSINLFFSLQGHRMNQVMKTLTVVATIFIPLTFIAGVYGMNFKNMPELSWKWGYFSVWIIMLSVLAGMLVYFKQKKWF